MDLSEEEIEFHPTKFILNTRKKILDLVKEGINYDLGEDCYADNVSHIEFTDKTGTKLISDCVLTLSDNFVNSQEAKKAKQQGQDFLDHGDIEGTLETYSFSKQTTATLCMPGVSEKSDIFREQVYGCRVHISEESFLKLISILKTYNEIQNQIDCGSQELSELQSHIGRVSEHFGLPIQRIKIDRQKEQATVEFSPLNETTSLEGMQLKAIDKATLPHTLQRALFDAFKDKLSNEYGFPVEAITRYGTEEVIGHFFLSGAENIEKLIQILDTQQSLPQVNQKMTTESWQQLLCQKRDALLNEASSQFSEKTRPNTGQGPSRSSASYDANSPGHQAYMKNFWEKIMENSQEG